MTISFPRNIQIIFPRNNNNNNNNNHQQRQQPTNHLTLKADHLYVHDDFSSSSSSDDDNDTNTSSTAYTSSLEYSEQQKRFFANECLRYGDYISLFTSESMSGGASSESTVGFLSVDGINLTCNIEG